MDALRAIEQTDILRSVLLESFPEGFEYSCMDGANVPCKL